MIKKRIICTFLYNGSNLVKGQKFINKRVVSSPIPLIKIFNLRKIDELIFIDIEASKKNREINYKLIENLLKNFFSPITIGGGIDSIEKINNILKCGADKVLINSYSFKNLNFIKEAINNFGSQCIVLSIDVKKINDKYFCFSNCGTINTNITLEDWLDKIKNIKFGELVINNIEYDGLLNGFDDNLISIVNKYNNKPLIVSGGAGKPKDFINIFKKHNVSGISASSLFFFRKTTPNDVKQILNKENIPVRIL
jgi:imidazole glycerol-phosphate synthase subunit HisF